MSAAKKPRKKKLIAPGPSHGFNGGYEPVDTTIISPSVTPGLAKNYDGKNWGHSVEKVTLNVRSTALAKLHGRKVITAPQLEAGERYQEIWWLSGVDQRITSAYGDAVGAGIQTYGMPATDFAAMKRQELRAARRALMARGFEWSIVERVCCHDDTLGLVGNEMGYSGGTARDKAAWALKARLDVLVDHFGTGKLRRSKPA